MKYLIVFTLMLFFIVPASVQAKNSSNTFRGRLIFVNNNLVEVKSGKREAAFYWKEGSIVLDKNGEVPKNNLRICQVVKVEYTTVGKRMEIVKIYIVNESNCYK